MRRLHVLVFSAAFLAACGEPATNSIDVDGGKSAERDGGETTARDGGEVTARDGGSTNTPADGGVDDAGDVPNDAGEPAPDGGELPRDGGEPISGVDPTVAGPFAAVPLMETIVAPSGNDVPMSCLVPAGGPHPAVLVLHGFRIPSAQYDGYVEHLASYGYVACTADYTAGFVANHVENAQDVAAAIDWLVDSSMDATHGLFGAVVVSNIALVGHSLGGKVAVLTAGADPRVAAVVGLDPVDAAPLCNATRCPDATDMLPLANAIPMAFLGETLDQTAAVGNQACAPAADNYQTFYTPASSPALEVTLNGANHMSFIDDPEACGIVCSFCQEPTMAQATALEISRAVVVAFLERHLRGDARYDAWLDGSEADTRWVQPGLTTIQSK